MAWRDQRADLQDNALKLADYVAQMSNLAPGNGLKHSAMVASYDYLKSIFDEDRGGFGSSPKFPSPQNFSFLLRYARCADEPHALKMVTRSLDAMRQGGIFDHIGLGYHRYSTDADWLLPHFEKMLYDQAMLTIAFLETAQASGDPRYGHMAEEILTYVIRDMTAPEGGFYSAEDADSEGVEGKFYVWKPEEIKTVLGEEAATLFCRAYRILPEGNFHDEATGEQTSENIPHLAFTLEEIAEGTGLSLDDLKARLEEEPPEAL